jgi:SAM-dependent methyltransferase
VGPLERLRQWRIDRLTDRLARRPSGRRARETYGAPDVHSFLWPNVLEALQLEREDRLLDIGCGGGVFLRHVRDTIGCEVAGIDHSRTLVRLARPYGVYGDAHSLPFADGAFTAVASIAAFFFLAEPVRALREMRRVLDPARGRIAIVTTSPEARGSPAAPEPIATRGHFYSDDALRELAVEAGLANVAVVRTDESGWGQLLTARAQP